MTTINKCPNCGGIFPLNKFVCEYCGYVESEKVKQLSETDTKEISFDDSLKVIQDNLNTLHDINKPSIKDGITGVLRVIAAIHTFGIVLIFWKRPRNRFNKKSYNKLKTIIKRNIDLLKVSSLGSDDLLNRINLIEQELERTDIEIKRNLNAKRLTSFITVAIYLSFIIINGELNPIMEHPVYPTEKTVSGDLADTLEIIQAPCKLKYSGGDFLQKFRLEVTLKPTSEFIISDSTELIVTLMLTDSAGNKSKDFYLSELEKIDKNRLIRELKKGSENEVIVEFEINEKRELKVIPENLTNFIINTEIKPKNQ